MAVLPTRSQLRKNLKALRLRLEDKPMDLDARMRMARTHRLLGERRPAINHYRSVARYLSLSGQPLQAIAVLKELLLVDARHEETLLFLAKLYARTRSADATNRGRVAVPILEDNTGPLALPEGLPASPTGLWRAIRPHSTDVYTVVHEPEEVGAEDELSIAAELRELDEAFELDDDDVLEERPVQADDPAPGAHRDDGPPSGLTTGSSPPRADGLPSLEPVEDEFTDGPDPFDYELIGPVTTEDIVLPKVPLFSNLPPEAFIELGHAMVFLRASPGDRLFSEGDPGDSCIVISRGRAAAFREQEGEEIVLKELGESDFAGVFALVAGQARQASLKALTDLEYFEIDRLAIRELIDRHPSADAVLRGFFRERLLLNLLGSLPVFSSISVDRRTAMVEEFTDKACEAEDELFWDHYGHPGLWVLLDGGLQLVDAEGASLRTVAPGDFVGCAAREADEEVGMESSCALVATQTSTVALLSAKAIADVLDEHEDLAGARDALRAQGLMFDDVVYVGSAMTLSPLED